MASTAETSFQTYHRVITLMDYLPISLDLKGKKCLIIGGGDVAARKLTTLLRAQADVDLLSLEFGTEVHRVRSKHDTRKTSRLLYGELTRKKEFEKKIVNKYTLIVAATDNPIINRMVSVVAQRSNILVNVVDNLELSSFILPAIIDRSPLLVAVSTAGVSPLLARKIREKIEWILPKHLGSIFSSLKSIRNKLKKQRLNFQSKKAFLENYIDARLMEVDEPASKLTANSNLLDCHTSNELQKYTRGKVYLVGAGPGDPNLLTIKALKLLQKADIVFYDALISDDILELIRRDAKLVAVGKRANRHSFSQQQINEELINAVEDNTTIVRLKGGDPFIFGRGGEELEALAKHGIKYEVVPGITAASGCASYAGIPLTHRDYSQSLHLVTAHEKSEKSSLDWNNLAKKNQTLVFYMGIFKNEVVSNQLIKNGLNPSTPVAVIENGTRPEQRIFTGLISQLSTIVENNNITPPAIILVGEVVRLQSKLSWFESEHERTENLNVGVI